jgi:hypothetical protein
MGSPGNRFARARLHLPGQVVFVSFGPLNRHATAAILDRTQVEAAALPVLPETWPGPATARRGTLHVPK